MLGIYIILGEYAKLQDGAHFVQKNVHKNDGKPQMQASCWKNCTQPWCQAETDV